MLLDAFEERAHIRDRHTRIAHAAEIFADAQAQLVREREEMRAQKVKQVLAVSVLSRGKPEPERMIAASAPPLRAAIDEAWIVRCVTPVRGPGLAATKQCGSPVGVTQPSILPVPVPSSRRR
jgi:hypothetical protein